MLNMTFSDAVISDDGRYRYQLRRQWHGGSKLNWVMLNPSIADGTENDATIRRCIAFSNGWGFGGMLVYNLFALRLTDPSGLTGTAHEVGPRNDEFLYQIKGQVVLAWGAQGSRFPNRTQAVLDLLHTTNTVEWFYCMGKTATGQPKHPLRLPAWTRRWDWTRG